jgi:hypothetical protein
MTTAEPRPAAASTSRPWQFSLLKLLILFVVLGLVFALARETWLALNGAREAARCSTCRGHHKQIALALHNYHDNWGSFPPAYTLDATGKPAHSWRVLILPYLEQQALYKQYRFNEPWNGPNNTQLVRKMPRIYRCPSCAADLATGETNYVVVVGPETVWPGTGVVTLSQCKDQDTLLVAETHGSGICWLEPRDLEFAKLPLKLNPATQPALSSFHPKRVNYSTVDGQIPTLQEGQLTPKQLQALLTIDPAD